MDLAQPNIYLVGFMGAGKSAVGGRIAGRLGLPFIDLDARIERRAGRAIADIFANEGEAFFRDLETRETRAIAAPAVIALGGGAFITPALREMSRERGVSVFLEWPFEVLLARAGGDVNRPLAREPEAMKRLYEARAPIYRTADLIWRSRPPHRETIDQTVDDVLGLLARKGIVKV